MLPAREDTLCVMMLSWSHRRCNLEPLVGPVESKLSSSESEDICTGEGGLPPPGGGVVGDTQLEINKKST